MLEENVLNNPLCVYERVDRKSYRTCSSLTELFFYSSRLSADLKGSTVEVLFKKSEENGSVPTGALKINRKGNKLHVVES